MKRVPRGARRSSVVTLSGEHQPGTMSTPSRYSNSDSGRIRAVEIEIAIGIGVEILSFSVDFDPDPDMDADSAAIFGIAVPVS